MDVYKLVETEKKFDVVGLTPAVDRVFQLAHMNTVFKVYASVAEALSDEGNGGESFTV